MTSKPNQEERAFPLYRQSGVFSEGMTLRDYFAGQAIIGIRANPAEYWMKLGAKEAETFDETDTEETFARWAYNQADAMIAARNK